MQQFQHYLQFITSGGVLTKEQDTHLSLLQQHLLLLRPELSPTNPMISISLEIPKAPNAAPQAIPFIKSEDPTPGFLNSNVVVQSAFDHSDSGNPTQ